MPTLSVIVPMFEVEAYLAACLDSIREQDYDDLEVLLVDDGSPDGSRAIAEQYAARDERFRVVARPNGGLGAARNTGIREAQGRFLTFVDSDDVLPPHALRALMDSVEASGSDIVAGGVSRFDSTRRWQPSWVEAVHDVRRTGITIDEHLPLLRNLYTWNKVFRRDFWDEQGLWFREGVAYEDQPIVTQLLVRAASIDVITDVVYLYRSRDDRSSISQQTATIGDLKARILAWQVSRETFRRELSEDLHLAWLATLFTTHFHWYLTSPGVEDDAYWAMLRTAILDFTEDAPRAIWDGTEPHKRVLIELVRQDRRADAQEFVRQHPANPRKWPTSVRDDGVLLHLPYFGDPVLDEDLFLLHPDQLELVHLAEGFAWTEGDGSGVGRLSGWAFLTKVDLSGTSAVTDVVLRNERTGDEAVFEATRRPDLVLPPPADDAWCDYRPGTFEVDLPLGDVLGAGTQQDLWRVWIRITIGGFSVTEPMTRVLRNSGAGVIAAHRQDDGSRLVADLVAGSPLGFRVDRAGIDVQGAEVDGRAFVGRLTGAGRSEVEIVELRAGPLRAQASPDASGELRVELPAGDGPPRPGRPRTWRVRARRHDGTTCGLVPTEELPGLVGRLGPATNRQGELVVTEWSLGVEAVQFDVQDDGTLLVRGRTHGDVDTLRLVAAGAGVRGESPACAVRDGRFEAVLELRHDLYRFGRLPLPADEYDVLALVRATDDEAEVEVPVRITPSVAARLPVAVDTGVHEGRVLRGPESRARVHLVRPLGPDRGRLQQHRLRTAPRTAGIERCLVVRSYSGERATDHGVSVQSELRRRGSDLPVYWAVHDHAIPVPDGGIPVIWNSREWFDLLGRAKYYLDNTHQPDYHRKPEGQIVIQALHGYPFKSMGRPHWERLRLSPERIESFDDRTAEWDYLVSPARYATELLVDAFGYHGEVLEIGYPRNDVLLSPDADHLRAEVRASLGVAEGQTVVLYAPTAREPLSGDDEVPPVPGHFDFARAVQALGDDVVFLVRGHAPHRRATRGAPPAPGCVDVTDYPEVSDLLLAADAAVLDYSSLRFDFGVTGKPMIFHVPDLEQYRATRGFLLDYEPTAPGPRVATTDEVVRHLADLRSVRDQYAAAYSTFRADFLDLEDGHAGRRLVDAVFAPRGDA